MGYPSESIQNQIIQQLMFLTDVTRQTVLSIFAIAMDGTLAVNETYSEVAAVRSFEEAKSALYGTISAAGAALERAARRRKSTVNAMASYLERLQLDVSGLSVIHVTGTKGKGSTCALAESVLRNHGFTTGLFTSPHLLEVTERVRVDGKPLTKEAFTKYFFEVWNRLQATRGGQSTTTATAGVSTEDGGGGVDSPADMPTFFHLVTLVGLWCFVKEGVDVCVVEVGMGGRFDATNVLPSPVACGVAMLDLDHTKVLGETLDKIAWEKGGIFKAGCRAFTVEQPSGGMSVLRQCSLEAGCKLEVASALPTHDPAGNPYDIGLAGEHQRMNAALALRLCAAWLEALQQQRNLPVIAKHQESTSGMGNGVLDMTGEMAHDGDDDNGDHRGGDGGGDGDNGRCSRRRKLKLCWPFENGKQDLEAFLSSPAVHKGLSECSWPGRCQVFRCPEFPDLTVYLDGAHTEQSMHACLGWFTAKTTATIEAAAAHTIDSGSKITPTEIKNDVVLQSQESRRTPRKRARRVLWFHASHERDVVPLLRTLSDARTSRASEVDGGLGAHRDEDEENGSVPLFDEVCFVEINSGRSSRFTPPTVQGILSRHGVPVVLPSHGKSSEASDSQGDRSGTWQRTMEQVWVSLQARNGGRRSTTRIGTVKKLLEGLKPAEVADDAEGDDMTVVTAPSEPGRSRERLPSSDSLAPTEILCTGSLYAVAAALEAMKAEVA